ncbi:hypothetical protein RB3970 [Rhodopirellula baltica SH 1]|uniref:Uncharacterized protein n=1 Tax=Rhodopirellula baltica (strain DSM 10527 / NCIMB 13988 / SH1) TaxID=243090 RepID=Q7UTC2_RHOBA|nr:hypothetical protein RB3970 [Rhodopirellula baltica SH 1]
MGYSNGDGGKVGQGRLWYLKWEGHLVLDSDGVNLMFLNAPSLTPERRRLTCPNFVRRDGQRDGSAKKKGASGAPFSRIKLQA